MLEDFRENVLNLYFGDLIISPENAITSAKILHVSAQTWLTDVPWVNRFMTVLNFTLYEVFLHTCCSQASPERTSMKVINQRFTQVMERLRRRLGRRRNSVQDNNHSPWSFCYRSFYCSWFRRLNNKKSIWRKILPVCWFCLPVWVTTLLGYQILLQKLNLSSP